MRVYIIDGGCMLLRGGGGYVIEGGCILLRGGGRYPELPGEQP